MKTLSNVPQTPAKAPNRKYRVPMSLWLVEKNQRRTKADTLFSVSTVEEKVVGVVKVISLFTKASTVERTQR